jgi:hypothetical protein
MKRTIAIFGLVGLIGCFLPLIAGISFFELRHLEWMPIVLMTAAFVVPMIAGLAGSNAGAALAGIIGFGYVCIKFGTGLWDLTIHAEIGGKMMAIAAVGGLISSIMALADRKRA